MKLRTGRALFREGSVQNVVPLVWTGQGELILETLHNAGSSSDFNIFFKREGDKKKEEKEVITTWGIRSWSPIQVTPPNRA